MPKRQTPLNVLVLYTNGHLGSSIILNQLCQSPLFNVVGVIKVQPLKWSFSGLKKLKKKMVGLGWRFGWLMLWQHFWQLMGYVLGTLFPFSKRLRPTWRLSQLYDFPVWHVDNVNAESVCDRVRTLNPELLVSAYFSQILKSEILSIPKRGCLNVHPGWLPAYRGAMAYFWVLKNGEDHAGVSVHWMDQGIDTGALIARKKFQISQGMTQQQVLVRTATIGARLLRRIGLKMLQETPLEPIANNPDEGDYYTFPGEKDFDVYFKANRFFRIRDVLKTTLRRPGK